MTWLAGHNATITKVSVDPFEGSQNLKIEYNGEDNPFAYQTALEAQVSYVVSGAARSDGTSIPKIIMTNEGAPVWTGTDSTDWQEFTFIVSSKGSALILWVELSGVGFAEFDNILVTKLATVLTKNTIDSHGGSRHLRVSSDTVIQDGDMEDTNDPVEGAGVWIATQADHGPDQPDASLVASYRMFDNGDTKIVNIAAKQFLVDGSMEAVGVSTWSTSGSPIITKEVIDAYSGNQWLKVEYNGTANPYVFQFGAVAGRTYRIKGVAKGDGLAFPSIEQGGQVRWVGTTSTDWQAYDISLFAANFGAIRFRCRTTSSGFVGFDHIHISEIPALLDGDAERAETLLPDGDCELPTFADWTPLNSTISKVTADPAVGNQNIRFTVTAPSGAHGAYQACLTLGAQYRLTGWARSDGNAIPKVGDLLSGSRFFVGTTSTSWQLIDVTFSNQIDSRLTFNTIEDIVGWWIEFDDLELTLVDDSLLDDTAMEDNDVVSWLVGNSAAITKQSTDTAEGVHNLRVTYNAVNDPYAFQAKLVNGVTYQVTGSYRGDGTATGSILHGATSIVTSTTSATWQTFSEVFTATATDFRLQTNTSVSGFAEFDNIVLTPVGEVMNWIPSTTATLSKQPGRRTNGVGATALRVETTSAADVIASQVVLSTSSYYRVTGWARSDGISTPKIVYEGTVIWIGTTSTDWQRIDITAVTGAAEDEFQLLVAYSVGVGEWCEFDDMEISPVLETAPATNNGATDMTTPLGQVLYFNGLSDYVDCGNDTVLQIVAEMTLSVWIKGDAKGVRIISKEDGTQEDYNLRVDTTNGKPEFTIFTGGTPATVEASTTVVDDDIWHFIVSVNDGTNLKIYVDGSLEGTNGGGAIDNDVVNLELGRFNDGGGGSEFFSGLMGPVNIYAEAKDATWVATEYSRGLAAIDSFVEKSTIGPRGQLRQLTVGQNTVSQKVLKIGETYNLTASAKSKDGVNVPKFKTGSSTWWTGTTNLLWQDATANFVADSELAVFDGGRWDNVILTEVLYNDVPAAAERDQRILQQYYLTGWYRTDGVSTFRIMDGDTLVVELAAADDWTEFAETWLTAEDTLKLTMDNLSGFVEFDDLTLAYGDGTSL